MRIKLTIHLFVLILILLLSGCANNKTKGKSDDVSSAVRSKTVSENEDKMLKAGSIEILQISRDVFYKFLENNMGIDLRENASKVYKYSEGGGNYQTSAVTLFKIEKEFVDFVGNKASVQEYLAGKGIKSNVEDILLFDAHHIPLTIFIKTTNEKFFLTINENYDDIGFNYRFYGQSEYFEKYKIKNCRLKVNGNDIINSKNIKLYNNYADLPFTLICDALGAKVDWENEIFVKIILNGKTYELDAVNCRLCRKNDGNDLFDLISGDSPYYKYLSGGEFYADSNTVECVLHDMGENVEISFDTKNNIVEIISK